MDKQKILVLDDDSLSLKFIQNLLQQEYDIALYSDPDQAENVLRNEKFDLVILDMNLDGISGHDVLKRYRKIIPNLNAIILTGYANVDSAVESMKLGALDYLSKATPNLKHELTKRVKEALSRKVVFYSPEEIISKIINNGESEVLEFKSSARWDFRDSKCNKEITREVIKTVSAFLNSYKGGRLVLGVNNDQQIIGLEPDYATLNKSQKRDIYENFLVTLVLDSCGKDCGPFIHIQFQRVTGKDICIVDVEPCNRPVFLKEDKGDSFYIRTGNSSKPLSHEETLEYCKKRWY